MRLLARLSASQMCEKFLGRPSREMSMTLGLGWISIFLMQLLRSGWSQSDSN